jgi:hypothetical protein
MKAKLEILAGVEPSYKPPKSAFKATQLEFAPRW